MSELESKLEQFRKRIEQLAKKSPSDQESKPEEKIEEKPKPVETAAKAEPVSAKIGTPLSQATGSTSQIDRTSVLASPKPASSEPKFSAPVIAPPDTDIPEVEDYMPWLKDEESTGEPKPVEKKVEPATPPVSHIQRPAAPAPVDKPEPSIQASSSAISPDVSSTPRTYEPPAAVPARDAVAPFEGTGQPRPIEKKPEVQVEVKAESVQVPETKPEPAARPAPAPQVSRGYRVTMKQPMSTHPASNSQEMAEMWGKLPRHIQFLMGPQPKEVAQHSYKQFKESREELIQRLLDPSLSLEEAARILNVCPTTVRRYTNRGVLPHFRTAGNQRRFRLSDVLAFLEMMSDGRFIDIEEEEFAGQA